MHGSPQRPEYAEVMYRLTGGMGFGSATEAATVGRPSYALRAEAYEMRQAKRRAGLGWLSGVGNVCACAALALCLGINVWVLEGTARAVLPTAPLLLLLHPYTPPFTALTTTNRYAPVASAIAAVFVASAAFESYGRWHDGRPTLHAMRSLALLLCAAPSLALCCKRLWDRRAIPDEVVWCAMPLNALPLLSHARPIYDLGGAGLVFGLVHVLLARQIRRAGAKYG